MCRPRSVVQLAHVELFLREESIVFTHREERPAYREKAPVPRRQKLVPDIKSLISVSGPRAEQSAETIPMSLANHATSKANIRQ